MGTGLLIFPFVYTAWSKLLRFDRLEAQRRVQAIPAWSVDPLAWAIPLSELPVALLLLTRQWRYAGIWGAVIGCPHIPATRDWWG
ncbi:MauE/DoxX family redox-associated membrane protein [Mucilaginibacter koreensis]